MPKNPLFTRLLKWALQRIRPLYFGPEVRALRRQPAPTDGVVFVGSSSIRLWDTLAHDMAPHRVIQRGFGGARIWGVVRYAEGLINVHNPDWVVVYAGSNDITGSATDLSPEGVHEGYRALIEKIHATNPQVQIVYLAIFPTPSRWAVWNHVQRANALIEATTHTDPRLHFIDCGASFLGRDGTPDRSLFQDDDLHLNPRGYAIWAACLKSTLIGLISYKVS